MNEQVTIHNKKVLIENAVIDYHHNQRIINITIALKQALKPDELQMLKQKIKQRFSSQD